MSLSVKYLNGKKFEVKCRTHTIITDQPVSADGTDRGMTPVEMLNGALASCAAHYAMLFLSNRTADLKGLEVQSSWQYSEDPHRVGTINLTVVISRELSEPERKGLVRSVEHCTVENTLKNIPEIKINVKMKETS